MAPKKVVSATPEEEPPKKKSKAQLKAEELATQTAADIKKGDQRLLAAVCGKPTATPEQKAMHEAYKKAARFSSEKDELLAKFLKDKKCTWYQGLEQVKSESHSNANQGLKGYGTRSTSQHS